MTLDKEKEKVVLQDITNLQDVILNFITYEKPVLYKGQLRIGSLAAASFDGADPLTSSDAPSIEVLPITDERLKKAWDHDLYRVRLRMTKSVFTMEIQ
ncbi:MAG: hypothetical protein K2O34_13760 [Acetatifactor sp.]|nr:hypothetical protein [Acetatifactor sp.]